MHTKITKIALLLAAVLLAAICFAGAAGAEPQTDGGIAWEVVDGKLIITIPEEAESGEYQLGQMKDYGTMGDPSDKYTNAPWNGSRYGITSIEFPSTGLKNIGNNAFHGLPNLMYENSIPEGVTTIGTSSFSRCHNLVGPLTIPESVTTIGKSVFMQDMSLTGELKIPKGVTKIEDSTFSGCKNLTGDLVIPENVTTIEKAAFSGCKNLTGELVIPEKVTTIGLGAFSGCKNLTGDLVIPENVTTINMETFNGCSGLKSVTMPNVTAINGNAFNESTNLQTASMPNVTTITRNAFKNCISLRTVTMPEVTSIHPTAFTGCTNLTCVIYALDDGSIPTTGMAVLKDAVWYLPTLSESTNDLPTDNFVAVLNGNQLPENFIQSGSKDDGFDLPELKNETDHTRVVWYNNSGFTGRPVTKLTTAEKHAYAVRGSDVAENERTGTRYISVNDAVVDAEDKDTIKLLADSQLKDELTIDKELTFDLNGKLLTAAKDKRIATIVATGDLTITDSKPKAETHYFKFISDGPWTLEKSKPATSVVALDKFNMSQALTDEASGKEYYIAVTGGIMYGGHVLAADTGNGGGLYLDGGKLTMKAGNLVGCECESGSIKSGSGGGVAANKNSLSFTMDGGRIAGCYAHGNAGGANIVSSAFVMNGDSKIIGCTANNSAGGVYLSGVTTFTMNNGHISNCYAKNNVGGVYLLMEATFTMKGGTITGCIANTQNAVGMNGGKLNLSNTARVINNKLTDGSENNVCMLRMPASINLDDDFDGFVSVLTNNPPKVGDVFGNAASNTIKGAENIVNENTTNGLFVGKINTADKTLYWTLGHMVVFNPNNGEDAWDQPVENNTAVEQPENPVRKGYTFNGWYNKGTKWDFKTKVTEDMTLTAKWEVPYPPSHRESGYTVILSETPTAVPTATQTPVATIQPIGNSTIKPTQSTTSKSPAPFVGILAGLGAALVLARMRR